MIPLTVDQQKASVSTVGRSHLTLGLCAAAAMLEGFDTQSMGVAAPRLVAEFGLSAAQSGLIFSATTMGLFVGAAVGGRVAESSWAQAHSHLVAGALGDLLHPHLVFS